MSALLIYSRNCKYSNDVVFFIDENPQLKQIVQFHEITTNGIPSRYKHRIDRVPTMLTKTGQILVGKEIKAWLTSLLPNDFESYTMGGFGTRCSDLNGDDPDDSFFPLDNYGCSLQPSMTPELKNRINQSVNEAFNEVKR